tara:strand:+ start:340 stop:474 length:135 start_codon:yes stop_codon:yes gene_type:complete
MKGIQKAAQQGGGGCNIFITQKISCEVELIAYSKNSLPVTGSLF